MESEKIKIKFRVIDKEVTFQASNGIRILSIYESISVINVVDVVEDVIEINSGDLVLLFNLRLTFFPIQSNQISVGLSR